MARYISDHAHRHTDHDLPLQRASRRGQPAGGIDPRVRRQFYTAQPPGGLANEYGTVFQAHTRWNLDHALCLYLRPDDPNLARRQRPPRAAACRRTRWQLLWHNNERREAEMAASSSAFWARFFKMSPAGDLLGSFPVYGFLDISIPKRARLSLGPMAPSIARPTKSGGGPWLRRGFTSFSAAGVGDGAPRLSMTLPTVTCRTAALSLAAMVNFYGTTEFWRHKSPRHRFIGYPQRAHTRSSSVLITAMAPQPFGQMIQATDGNFYGTTVSGGSLFNGTMFQLTPAGCF